MALLEEKEEKKRKEREEKEQRKLTRELNKKKREEEQKRKAEERAKKAAEKQAENKKKEAEKQQKRQLNKLIKSQDKVVLALVARARDSAQDSTRQKAPKLSSHDNIYPNTCCACFGLYEDDVGTGCEWLQCCCSRWIHED